MDANQKVFLESLLTLSNLESRRLLLDCTDEQLNIILCCIQNLNSLVLTRKEESSISKFKKVILAFKKIKKKKDFKLIRQWLVNHQKFLKAVLGITLFKVTEFAISCLLSST